MTQNNPLTPPPPSQHSALRPLLLGTSSLSNISVPPPPAPEIIVSPVSDSSSAPRVIHSSFRRARWPSLRGARREDIGQTEPELGLGIEEQQQQQQQRRRPTLPPGYEEATSPVSPEQGVTVVPNAAPATAVSAPEVSDNQGYVWSEIDGRPTQQYARAPNNTPLPYPLSPSSPLPQRQQFQAPPKPETGTPPPPFEAWSATPSRLNQSSKFAVLFAIGDAVMAIAPIAFIILGICVARLHGQEVEGNGFGKNVKNAMDLGPTLYPIMFAAVAGKAMKITARFCAEKGAKLGTLELLMASQTVWGTFESQVLLKNLSVLGAHLFFLWALSPIGGQASLRVLGTGTATTTNQTTLVYMPTGGMSGNQTQQSAFNGAADPSQSGITRMNVLFNSALLVQVEEGQEQRDLWHNIRIPRIDTLDASTIDADGWISTPSRLEPNQYSSILGLPVAGIPKTDQTAFEMSSSYMEFDCPIQADILLYETGNGDAGFGSDMIPRGFIWGDQGTFGRSSGDIFGNTTQRTVTPLYLDTATEFSDIRVENLFQSPNETAMSNPALSVSRTIIFGSKYWPMDDNTSHLVVRTCNVTSRYVDTSIDCRDGICAVQRIRRSVRYKGMNQHITPLDRETLASNMFKLLPRAGGQVHIGREDDATLTEMYIRGGSANAFDPNDVPDIMLKVSLEDFNARFTRIMNAYYSLSLSPYYFAQGADISQFGPFGNSTFANGTMMRTPPWFGVPTKSTSSVFHDVYQCDFFWLGLLLASSSVLLCIGIAGLAMKIRCNAPDMFGYVASMTYDNPHIDLPPGGSVFGAMERAQRLRRMEVRIGDVKPDQAVGHVAFASTGKLAGIGSLQKDRLYV